MEKNKKIKHPTATDFMEAAEEALEGIGGDSHLVELLKLRLARKLSEFYFQGMATALESAQALVGELLPKLPPAT